MISSAVHSQEKTPNMKDLNLEEKNLFIYDIKKLKTKSISFQKCL
jgi:hypothetical protein